MGGVEKRPSISVHVEYRKALGIFGAVGFLFLDGRQLSVRFSAKTFQVSVKEGFYDGYSQRDYNKGTLN